MKVTLPQLSIIHELIDQEKSHHCSAVFDIDDNFRLYPLANLSGHSCIWYKEEEYTLSFSKGTYIIISKLRKEF